MTFNLADIQIEVVDSTDKAHEMLSWIGSVRTPVMAVDIESDGLQWYDGKLKLVQFGTLTQGWAIPFDMYPALATEALNILDARRMPLVGHNFHFDLHFLDRHTGWSPKYWGLYHDTLLAASVLESSGPKALKALSEIHVTTAARHGQQALQEAMKQGGWDWATVPTLLEPYWVYGVLDTILTANLLDKLLPLVHEKGCQEAYEVERGCMPALYAMERRGILVDSEHCNDQITYLQQQMDQIRLQALTDYGIESIGSGDQLVRAFLDNGVELRTRTPSGTRFSMSKEAFEELEAREGKHPLVALVSRYRKAEKFCSSYYESFLRFQCSDGRVRPQYKQAEARTGRMSAQYPAIQTLPRPGSDEDPEDVREMSTAVRNSFVTEEGNSFISTDFTNIEARIFAHFAKEEGMLSAIRRGIDLHGYTAQQVYHQWEEVAPKNHPLRQVAKSVLFCMLFGGGPSKVAVTAKVSEEEALNAFNGVHRAFPGIKQFMKSIERMAKANYEDTGRAWVRGIDGRILMLRENDDRFYAFTNYLIQGSATVLLKQRLGVIHNMGLSEYCVAAIHDEVVAEVPDDEVEEFQIAIAEAMLDEAQFAVPALAEPGKPAKRLGDAK